MNTRAIVYYILERQNEDGGYTFARGAESNAQDTYYALEILRMLDAKPTNLDKTVRFVQGLQHSDGGFDSVKSAYYVITILSQLGAKPTKPIDQTTLSLEILIEGLENPHVYIEAISEIESIYLAVKLLNSLNFSLNSDRIVKQVLKMQNIDGSFGSRTFSRLASTFYALAILGLTGYDVKALSNTLTWIRQCEISTGGFTADPELTSPYIAMEDLYFGIKSLEALGETCRFPRANLELIAKFQNPNGGFRRSIYLGISDFESTYQTLSSVKTILVSYKW